MIAQSHSNQFLSTTDVDVHVGKPSFDPNRFRYAETKVHIHEFRNFPLDEYVTSPRFLCLGLEWNLRFRHLADAVEFALICQSSTIAHIHVDALLTYGRHFPENHSIFRHTHKFHHGSILEGTVEDPDHILLETRRGRVPVALAGWRDKVMVVTVRMTPAGYPFRAFVPMNPSACKTMQGLFNDAKYADVVFQIGEEVTSNFYAHRMILESCAPVLAELSRSDTLPSQVVLQDESPGAFEDLLRYVYGFELRVRDTLHAKEMIEIADKYGVSNLKLQAEAYYVASIELDTDNLMENVQLANALNCAVLNEVAMDYISNNLAEVVEETSLTQFPGGLVKDMLVAIIRKNYARYFDFRSKTKTNTTTIGDLRRQAHANELEVDGSRDMLISALSQLDSDSEEEEQESDDEDSDSEQEEQESDDENNGE